MVIPSYTSSNKARNIILIERHFSSSIERSIFPGAPIQLGLQTYYDGLFCSKYDVLYKTVMCK